LFLGAKNKLSIPTKTPEVGNFRHEERPIEKWNRLTETDAKFFRCFPSSVVDGTIYKS
jgi:hypothetical protein